MFTTSPTADNPPYRDSVLFLENGCKERHGSDVWAEVILSQKNLGIWGIIKAEKTRR